MQQIKLLQPKAWGAPRRLIERDGFKWLVMVPLRPGLCHDYVDHGNDPAGKDKISRRRRGVGRKDEEGAAAAADAGITTVKTRHEDPGCEYHHNDISLRRHCRHQCPRS